VGGNHIQTLESRGVIAVSRADGEIADADIIRVIDASQAISIPPNREVIHVIPKTFTLDGQTGIKDPLGMTGIRLEVETQIVTGATTAIRNLAKCISEVGIDIAALVYSGLASSEAVLSETEKELGVILVDIGAGTTDVAIWVDGALSYSSVLPVGARNVTNDIAVGLRVSLESAEKIKLHLSEKAKPKFAFDTDENDEPEKKEAKNTDELDIAHLGLPEELKKVSRKTLVEGIIKPRLSEIFTFIGLEIQKSGFGGMTPSGVVITGGGSMTVGILEASRARLAMPCRVGSAFSQPIVKLSGLTDEINGPQFSAAAGLILHGSTTTRDFQSKKSNFRIPASLPKLPGFGKITPKLDPGKIVEKISKLLKSFLP
jgi:cell division protein FtsA